MALKVLSVTVPERFNFSHPNGDGIMFAAERIRFSALVNIDGDVGYLDFDCDVGCPYNGASNPLNWPIKNYYGESRKDVCGLGHDILYAWGGYVEGYHRKLKNGECDDYIRGSMREADWKRIPAGIVDWCCRHLAHFLHFGTRNDKEGMHLKSKVSWRAIV